MISKSKKKIEDLFLSTFLPWQHRKRPKNKASKLQNAKSLIFFLLNSRRVHSVQDSLISAAESLDKFRGLVNLALILLVSLN